MPTPEQSARFSRPSFRFEPMVIYRRKEDRSLLEARTHKLDEVAFQENSHVETDMFMLEKLGLSPSLSESCSFSYTIK
ncbi:hypothetical protein [Virgibacillus sp.]|uniref:hypothetical protein n=1 Tax=Virgibacillus sp. TaxID=1872700 RepID=UPI0025FD7ADC|nr:hypothetical protein [Virgibacillus sp.]